MMISPVQFPSCASNLHHHHFLHQHTTLIHFEAVTLVTPKQKVEKSQKLKQNLKSFFLQKPPVLPSIVLASKAKLTLLSSPQGSAVMARILIFVHFLVTVILRVIHTV